MRIPKPLRSQQWRTLDKVRLFCPHQLVFDDGRKVVVDIKKLKALRDKMNARSQLSGTLATTSVDHIVTVDQSGKAYTKPSKDIDLLGYYGNYDIEMDGSTPWLVADAFVSPEKYDTAKQLPFVSVEYHPEHDIISNVAMTKHRPQLDVGTITPYHWERGRFMGTGEAANRLVAYSIEGNAGGVVIYSTERPTMSQPNTLNLDAVVAAGEEFVNQLKALKGTPPAVATRLPSPEAQIAAATVVAPVASYTAPAAQVAAVHPDTIALNKLLRRGQLEALAKHRNVDVDKELELWGDTPQDIFDKHCTSITASYSAVASGGAKVLPLDAAAGDISKILPRAKDILSARVQQGKDTMNIQNVMDRLRSDPTWNGD